MTVRYPVRSARSRSNTGGAIGCLALLVAVVLVVIGGIAWSIYAEFGTQKNVTFTVTGLDDQTSYSNGSLSHKYLVFTVRDAGQKTEVFKDTDAILHGKTDSSDVWARFINAGKGAVWTCPVYGFRIFLFSSYRNILDGCTLDSKPGQAAPGDVGTRDPLASNLYPTPTGRAPVSQMLTGTAR